MHHVVIEEALELAVACQGIQFTAVRNGLIAKQLHESTAGSRFGRNEPAGVLAVSGSCVQVGFSPIER